MEDPATPEHLFYPGIGTVTTFWHFINPDPQLQSKNAHKVCVCALGFEIARIKAKQDNS